MVGQTIIALGNPVGYQSSVSVGVLSGKDRTVGTVSGLLQTDAAINPGNSGGPLIDIAGRLVGVSSQKISYLGGRMPAESLAFAIPAEIVADWARMAMAIARGERKPPDPVDISQVIKDRTGLILEDLTPEAAQALGFRFIAGLLVSGIEQGSPVEKAGIQVGDVLLAVGRYPTHDITSLPKEIGQMKSGNEVSMILARAKSPRPGVVIQERYRAILLAR